MAQQGVRYNRFHVTALCSPTRAALLTGRNSHAVGFDVNNWRNRSWTPSLEAAGVAHRRIYDLRHTYASWSLAAGVDIFTLARRMGTSVKMIDHTYGHLIAGADIYERELLDAFDEGRSAALGRYVDAEEAADAA